MRSQLAGLDGIDESNVDVNFEAKTCTVDLAGSKLTPADLVGAFEGTRFKVAAK